MPAVLTRWSIQSKVLFLVSLVLIIMAGNDIVALFSLEKAMMEDRQARTRMLVEVAYGVMEHFHQKEKAGTLPRAEAQNAAKEAIKTLRYQEKDYFWINDMQPAMVMHPYKPELDGKNVSDSKDPNGKFLFREFVRVVQEKGGGFVDYQWPKPGLDKPAPKISYVKGFQPWGWVIGSGIYVDDVETAFWQKARYDLSQLVAALIFMAAVSFLVMKSIRRTVTTISGVVDSMADGNLTTRVVVDNPHDEVQQIGARVNQLADSLEKTVRLVSLQSATVTVGVQRLGSVRESLLTESTKTTTTTREAVQDTQKVVHASHDIRKAVEEATGSLSRISHSVSRLSDSMTVIASSSEQASSNVNTMAAAAEEMTANVQDVSNNLVQVNHSVNSVSAAVEEMTVSLTEVRRRCQMASEQSSRAINNAQGSQQVIQKLSLSAQEIGNVVGIINSIAEQTNMLALNAAIEAAGAGEAGKGFAVVANEVKELARQTADATQQISQRVEEIQTNTRQVSSAVDTVIKEVAGINQANGEITMAVNEQGHSIQEISRSMGSVAKAADSVTISSQELAHAATEVARAAGEAASGTASIVQSIADTVRESQEVSQQGEMALHQVTTILQAAEQSADLSGKVMQRMEGVHSLMNHLSGSVNYVAALSQMIGGSASALKEAQQGLHVGDALFDVAKVKENCMILLEKIEYAATDAQKKTDLQQELACNLDLWFSRLPPQVTSNEAAQDLRRINQALNANIQKFQQTTSQEQRRSLVEGISRKLEEYFLALDRLYCP